MSAYEGVGALLTVEDLVSHLTTSFPLSAGEQIVEDCGYFQKATNIQNMLWLFSESHKYTIHVVAIFRKQQISKTFCGYFQKVTNIQDIFAVGGRSAALL